MDEQEILNNFGFNFKIARMKLKMTQDDVVEKLGFSKSYISNVENGQHNLSLINAIKFASLVDKTLDEMFKAN